MLTEDQKQEMKEKFRGRRKRQLMISIPLVVLVLGFIFMEDRIEAGSLPVPAEVAGGLFFAVVIGAVAYSFMNWRCPSCNKYLGKGINPKFCTQCGVELR